MSPLPIYITLSTTELFVIVSVVFAIACMMGYSAGYDRCKQDQKILQSPKEKKGK